MASKKIRGVYRLPSGAYNVKITIRGVRYNLGTYEDKDDAEDIVYNFCKEAPRILDDEGPDTLQRMAEQQREQARHTARALPSGTKGNRKTIQEILETVQSKQSELQNQVDKLTMQVDLLRNAVHGDCR